MCLTSALALAAGSAGTDTAFDRFARFPTILDMDEGADTARVTTSEIVAATNDDLMLVRTDSPLDGAGAWRFGSS